MRFRPSTLSAAALLAALLLGAPALHAVVWKPFANLSDRLEPWQQMTTLPILGAQIMLSKNKHWAAAICAEPYFVAVRLKGEKAAKDIWVPLPRLCLFSWDKSKARWTYTGLCSPLWYFPNPPMDYTLDNGSYRGGTMNLGEGYLCLGVQGCKDEGSGQESRCTVYKSIRFATDAVVQLTDDGALQAVSGGKVCWSAADEWQKMVPNEQQNWPQQWRPKQAKPEFVPSPPASLIKVKGQ